VSSLDHVEPLRGIDLVGADNGAHFLIQHLRRGAGQGAEACRFQALQKVLDTNAEGGGALGDLQRRKGMDMDIRTGSFDGFADIDIGLAGVFGVDTTLHAYLGAAPRPGLFGTAGDFVLFQVVGLAAQVLAGLAFREGTKLALVGADIGVVDIAGYHIADPVAAQLAAHRVGLLAQVDKIIAPRLEQSLDLLFRQPFAAPGAGYKVTHLRADLQGIAGNLVVINAANLRQQRRRGRCRRAGFPVVGAGKTLAIHHAQYRAL